MRVERIRQVQRLSMELDTLMHVVEKEIAAENKRRVENGSNLGEVWDWGGTPAAAALRRKSMDLTRALAQMRRY